MDAIKALLVHKEHNWLIATLNSVGDAIITVNSDYLIDFANEEALRILACPLDKILYTNIQESLHIIDGQSEKVIELWRPEYHDKGLTRHAFYLTPGGEKKYLSAHVTPIVNDLRECVGKVIIFRDITRVVDIEESIARERNNLEELFELLPMGMLFLDHDLRVKKVNHAFLNLFQLRVDTLVEKPFGEAIQCVYSFERGCGFSDHCHYCQFRKAIQLLIDKKSSIKDHIVEMSYIHNNFPIKQYFNIHLTQVESHLEHRYVVLIEDITDRINYENSLEEARKLSLSMLDSLPVMIYKINKANQCDFINQTFKSYMHITKETFYSAIETHILEDQSAEFISTLKQAIFEEHDFSTEIELMSPYGLYRRVLSIGRPYFSEEGSFEGILGLFLDVHDTRMAEFLYRQSQNKYFSLFKNLESSISYHKVIYSDEEMLVDTEIIEMNAATYKTFGISEGALIGTKLSSSSFLERDEIDYLMKVFSEVLLTGENVHLSEYHMKRLDKWIEVSIYSPEENYIAMLVTDIDFKKRSEIKLKLAVEQSEEANRAKSEFLANMSHEIRTPLNGIVGMIDLTMIDKLSAEQKDNLLTAKQCVHSLIDIINDVLDFAKMEAGKLRVSKQVFRLDEQIDSVIKTHKNHAVEKGILLSAEYKHLEANLLLGDSKRLKQILNNLISNAIKFTNQGEVRVAIRANVSDQEAEMIHLRVDVIDTGIGIPEEKKAALFKSFSQVDGSYTRQYGGTGLGLVISKQLAEMMGGTIDWQSKVGSGSTFTVNIPFEKASQEERVIEDNQEEKLWEGRHILLVEDDRVNQIVLGKMLESFKIECDLAVNGYEAVSKCAEIRYDLIIMDVQMPIMDGIQATQYIRGQDRHEVLGTSLNLKTPIIALTAFALKGDEAIFKASGMVDYLSKPVDRLQMMALLKKYFDKKEADEWDVIQQIVAGFNPSSQAKMLEGPRALEELNITQPQRVEIEKRLKRFKTSFEEENFVMMEIAAHQLKQSFEEVNVEELKQVAFKMELEIRKNKLGQIPDLLGRIESLWTLFIQPKEGDV